MSDPDKRDIGRAYSRGYMAGRKGNWPDHKPPTPPDPRVAALFITARALRDGVDARIATFDPSDPFYMALAPLIDELDAEMALWTVWLKQYEESKS